MRYGYIGLGQMGASMAECVLSTGAALTVFDLDERAVVAAVERGATAADSCAAVAAASDIVSVCVPAAPHVEAVMSGPDGIGDGAHDGLVVLIHSTVHPDTMVAARNTAAPWGVAVHDVCVAGGWDAAAAGDLTLFVGGADEMTPGVRDLLGVYGSNVIAAGPVGSGAALKVGCNVMTFAQHAAISAAFDLVTGAGADTDALIEAWRHLGVLGTSVAPFAGGMSLRDEDITGDIRDLLVKMVAIAQKDLELALALGENGRLGPSPVVTAIHDAMPVIYRIAEPEKGP